ncbi:MAG: LacI family DNA-binding transcriptional regulator [Clostridia bacterium]|nr:LacI family DNA-binding transcriptional regulator [Clostridia bacterium]
MSTIQDVARLAGVSVATVSRVLNNSPSVTAETKDLVNETIKKLNYQPNLLGRNLRRSQTKMILVLLPNISNPFYAGIVKGIEDVAHKNGYNVMLCNTDSDVSRERIYMDLLRNRLSDGVIFMAPEVNKEELTEIGKLYPVVQCCEYKEGASVSHVSIDNFSAAYKATRHLIGLGHKRIGFLGCQNTFISTIQRENGYKKALADHDIPFDQTLVKYGDYGFTSGVRAGKQFMAMKERPTALFAISDMMAIGAIKSAKEEGLRIPEDLAVVGFDNISFAAMYDPMLTTISQPKYDLGCAAMDLVLRRIRGELDQPEDLFLEHEFIIRESTVK